ncbi:hypothetical protein QVD17_19749 [Tagetes erecta]|uniref:Uncharacterized protein n=1 Tax=Tagetes erecta TaxID=13708 RepID=A0AAD8KRH7_TARER|nr:hypothetical protein QVD17_19749 [Tagetes erecta]
MMMLQLHMVQGGIIPLLIKNLPHMSWWPTVLVCRISCLINLTGRLIGTCITPFLRFARPECKVGRHNVF